ncbi:ABC transporter permease [Candidatus Chloroploca sp. Khr17]|uniref:ABC transporter permease n=1 Tax=Candidatus Chloroploca sp. Khr17 TaxID=2496869 RepID=UPI00101BD9F7|nr:ABC transporter permease [Candidatus Chloroploca sp. Khr17]
MNRLLHVAHHEYLLHVRRRGFVLATLGLPLLVLVGMALIVIVNLVRPETAIGYVDQSGLFSGAALTALSDHDEPAMQLVRFADPEAARAALATGAIESYVVIAPDYAATGALVLYGAERLSPPGQRSLRGALNQGLLARADLAADVAMVALDPLAKLESRQVDGTSLDPSALGQRILAAMLGSLLFMVTIFSSASYLLQALVEEKENRTIEIVTTSISPGQLIGGKVLGLGLLGFTIALVWLSGVALAWGIGAVFVDPLREVRLSLGAFVPVLLFFIPGYLLFAGLMVAISAIVPTAQEAQQFAGLMTVVAVLPLMLSVIFFTNPDGLIAVTLSLFPLSAPIGMLLRLVLGNVPGWQIGLSFSLLVVSAWLAIGMATRIFRVGMLRYGQRLRVREIVRALRVG